MTRLAVASRRALGWLYCLVSGECDTDASESEAGWTELCVYADASAHDRLLAQVVRPFAQDLSLEAGQRLFFLRERREATRSLRIWVQGAGDEALAKLALGLQATGTVEVRPGTPSELTVGQYGGKEAAALLIGLLVEAAPFLLDEIATMLDGRADRTTVALDMMVAHLPAIDIARVFPQRYKFARTDLAFPASYPVYRSHADGFFVMSTDPVSARAQFDTRYDSASSAIRQRVGAVLDQFAGGPVVSQAALRWNAIARAYLERCDAALRSGTLSVSWNEGYIGDTHDLQHSTFHQIVQGAFALRAFLRKDSGYLAARTTMSALYLVLGSLGVGLVDRVFLCNAICRAFEQMFGIDTVAIIRGLADGVPRTHASAAKLAGD